MPVPRFAFFRPRVARRAPAAAASGADGRLPDPASAARFDCPVCAMEMTITAEHAPAEFGDLGIVQHALACDACGMLAARLFHPDVGYDLTMVR